MGMDLKTSLISKAKELGWEVDIDESGWEFKKYSPAGEDFFFGVSGEDVVAEVLEYYETFDTEDHVMGLMEAKNNGFRGVPGLKELVEDADAIEKMLEELYDALSDVEEAYYRDEADTTNCELGIYDCDTCNINGECIRQQAEGGDEG